MKKHYVILFMGMIFMHSLISVCTAQSWALKDAFKSEVFIENNGQFNNPDGQALPDVKYAVNNGDLKVYFTPSGLSYHFINVDLNPKYKEEKEEIFEKIEQQIRKNGKMDESMKKYFNDKSAYVNIEWEGANPDARVVVTEQVPDNYSYSVKNETGEYSSVLANAFKKLTYQNIYPNIDIEYYFPQNNNGELGVEYKVVVHPGGDLTLVKMKYSGMQNISMDGQGNVVAAIPDGYITDHTPALSFVGSESNKVQAGFMLNGQTVSFDAPQYDKTQQLVIDPFTSIWSISPGFTTQNDGYTVRVDYYHNVYVMGGKQPGYQMKKFNSAGVLQWTAAVPATAPIIAAYGDMVVLPSGKAIAGHGFGSPGTVYLVNPANGAVTNKSTTPGNEPGWRFSYNQAVNNGVLWIGGGSNNGAHLYQTDTNITAVTLNFPWAVTGSSSNTEDISYLAQDKTGSFVYITNASNSSPNSSTTAPKTVKVSTATPGTAIWKVNEPTLMRELGQGSFMNGGTTSFVGGWATGVNGMVVCDNYMYTFDGINLRAYDPATGNIVYAVTVPGGTQDKNSGIDVDNCCRVYVGVNGAIKRYTSALVLDTTITTTSTVYDLRIDPQNDSNIYVTGKGFVQLINGISCVTTTPPPVPIFTSSDTAFCNEGGECIDFTDHSTGNPTSWSWRFPGAQPDTSTAQNPTGICYYTPGSYNVTLIVSNSGGTDSMVVNPLIIFSSGAAAPTITVKGGDTLFCSHEKAYQWYFNGSPISGATDSFYVATQDGTYNVYITDNYRCTRLGNGLPVTLGLNVNDISGGGQLSIYPNPAGAQFTIRNTNFTIKKIEIYNVLGEIVQSQSEIKNPNSDIIINSSSFAKGVYLVELTSNNKIYRTKVMKE